MLGNLCDGSFQGHMTGWPWSQDQEFRFPQRLDSEASAVSSEMLQLWDARNFGKRCGCCSG